MSNAALQAVTQKPTKSKPTDLAHLLMSPQTLAQIKAALPRHMTAERMARVAVTEIRKTPALAKCDVRTFMGAVRLRCCRIGGDAAQKGKAASPHGGSPQGLQYPRRRKE